MFYIRGSLFTFLKNDLTKEAAMNYDESVFKEKANRKARKIWLIFAILLSANYGSDVAGGLNSVPYYIIFLALSGFPCCQANSYCE